ncbi:hypothetical protein NRIC0767_05000 [Lactobacillus delbrueckii subsp. allosunkii]|nr:hypothetical protein NRIC0767_05000 [Lactobacillus delbrueckii subsp. sunkii]
MHKKKDRFSNTFGNGRAFDSLRAKQGGFQLQAGDEDSRNRGNQYPGLQQVRGHHQL